MGTVTLMFCRPINVHLLNLLDGLYHETSLYKVFSLDRGRYHRYGLAARGIDGSRVALVVELLAPDGVRMESIVWD